ncbi:hypothetical protein PIB30_000596 [Stylosanthes scabra]|uniref:Late embryogenesis abundant protein LEA-2 subgroup domain-containing protein n=1 Tax=Stylosanthes scabra TaxID=79078 RepID=A0ABU6X4P4_9FABA|nr:hypothetical protein [Stylosanthes scabra]
MAYHQNHQSPQRRDPFKPLSSFISPSPSPLNPHQEAISEKQISRIKTAVCCCGCFTALICIVAVILIVLSFTVYNVQDPDVRLDSVTIVNGTLNLKANATATSSSDNVTLLAHLIVKNTNSFTFRYGTTTTQVSYDGIEIGVGTLPPGKTKGKRTAMLNVTMEVVAKKLVDAPGLRRDVEEDQAVNISSYTRIDGRVKVLNMFKRKVVVVLNCTVEYNVTTGHILNGDNCLKDISI